MNNKFLHQVSKVLILTGGITWGIFGATALLGMAPFNLVSFLLGLVGAASFASWVYVLVGVAAAYGFFHLIKHKDY